MTHRRLHIIVAAGLILLTGCSRQQPNTLTGRVLNARSGDPVRGATVASRLNDTLVTHTGKNGYYALSGLSRRDSVNVSAEGYRRSTVAVAFEAQDQSALRKDVYLEPGIDTAFTATGPVDARMYLEHSSLKKKKLSMNEARHALLREFPGARVRKGTLVTVSEREEWLFEMKLGRASASVYLDAYSGKISSVESDDPTLDRVLQSHVRQ